nr:MAG TPA: hypothetical protein [Caudoviricetes sp.]
MRKTADCIFFLKKLFSQYPLKHSFCLKNAIFKLPLKKYCLQRFSIN